MRTPVLLLLPALLAAMPATARAQAGPDVCNLIESVQFDRDVSSGDVEVQGPFLFRCESGAELRAEHGLANEFSREIVLTGNVFFQDSAQTLTADRATYSSSIGRLYATGNVVFTNRVEGSTIRGPELEYFRAMEGRPVAQVNAGQRPHLTLQPKEQGADAEPLELDADRVTIVGQDDLSAYGDVIIERSDLDATAREAQYDAETGRLELRGDAEIVSEEFSLAGEVVEARLVEGSLEQVHARTDASLEGRELTVTAPDLQLFFREDLLQRAVARGAGEAAPRPVAVARGFRLEADSIDAVTPGQRLDQVVAIGNARGEAIDTTRADSALAHASVPDTARADSASVPTEVLELAAEAAAAADSLSEASDTTVMVAAALIDRDWIVGDTLIGFFGPADSTAAPGDSAAADTAMVLKRILAKGSAQSLYRVQPQDSARAGSTRRAVNYLAGEVIELDFAGGELQTAHVTGLRRGLYLDPAPPPAAPADTSATSGGGAVAPPPNPRREGR